MQKNHLEDPDTRGNTLGDGLGLELNLKFWCMSTTEVLDAILNLGSSASLIDQEITDDLPVTVNPFTCDLSQCFSLEGVQLTTSVLNVIGWVELELGILEVGCLTTRLFVTKSMFNKGVPIVLGNHQIKQIFDQANVSRMDCWQQP